MFFTFLWSIFHQEKKKKEKQEEVLLFHIKCFFMMFRKYHSLIMSGNIISYQRTVLKWKRRWRVYISDAYLVHKLMEVLFINWRPFQRCNDRFLQNVGGRSFFTVVKHTVLLASLFFDAWFCNTPKLHIQSFIFHFSLFPYFLNSFISTLSQRFNFLFQLNFHVAATVLSFP